MKHLILLFVLVMFSINAKAEVDGGVGVAWAVTEANLQLRGYLIVPEVMYGCLGIGFRNTYLAEVAFFLATGKYINLGLGVSYTQISIAAKENWRYWDNYHDVKKTNITGLKVFFITATKEEGIIEPGLRFGIFIPHSDERSPHGYLELELF